jgi:NAD(P)-dependent dehydrogenase (short-subunit alcohol dehydrogenase family)
MAAYGASKLANLMFALELQRRSDAAGWGLMSLAAHPGYARTELIANGPGNDSLMSRIARPLIEPWASQSAADGALPQLFAATSPGAVGGGYYGPSRLMEMKGPPGPARICQRARLWEVSEQLTGVAFGG